MWTTEVLLFVFSMPAVDFTIEHTLWQMSTKPCSNLPDVTGSMPQQCYAYWTLLDSYVYTRPTMLAEWALSGAMAPYRGVTWHLTQIMGASTKVVCPPGIWCRLIPISEKLERYLLCCPTNICVGKCVESPSSHSRPAWKVYQRLDPRLSWNNDSDISSIPPLILEGGGKKR